MNIIKVNKIFYLILPFAYGLCAYLSTFLLSFKEEIGFEILLYSMFDIFFSVLVLMISINWLLEDDFNYYINDVLIVFLEKYWYFIFFLSLVCSYFAKSSIIAISLGVTREELSLGGGSVNFIMILLSPFFKVIAPVILYFNSSIKLKIIFTFGLFSALLFSASMAELLYFGFLILTLYTLFSHRRLIYIVIPFVLIIFMSFLVARYGQTVRYGQNVDIYTYVTLLLEKIFKYRAFSYYLSNELINNTGFEYKLFYPFFGYPYEWVVSKVYPSLNYFDSSFLVKFHYLGGEKNSPYLANVIYPWWSFFVFSFGPVGILIKSVWVLFIIKIMANYKLYLSLLYFIALLLYIGQFTFPFISINALATLLVVFLVDILCRTRIRCK